MRATLVATPVARGEYGPMYDSDADKAAKRNPKFYPWLMLVQDDGEPEKYTAQDGFDPSGVELFKPSAFDVEYRDNRGKVQRRVYGQAGKVAA